MNEIPTGRIAGHETGVERYLVLVDCSKKAPKIEEIVETEKLMVKKVCRLMRLRVGEIFKTKVPTSPLQSLWHCLLLW